MPLQWYERASQANSYHCRGIPCGPAAGRRGLFHRSCPLWVPWRLSSYGRDQDFALLFCCFLLGSLVTDKFAEAALIAADGLLLIQEDQILLIKFAEEVIPGDLLQGLLTAMARKLNPQNAHLTATFSPFDRCRFTTACLGPFTNSFMIGCYRRLASHKNLLIFI